MENKKSIWKKLHKWPGLIISFLLLYYGVTGIFMNHRELFSGMDVSRSILPSDFHYKNWNNSALKGNLIVNSDSILVFGNVGIWVTDSAFSNYRSMNDGFPKGIDHRKIFEVHRCINGDLFAATQFGLYVLNTAEKEWQKIDLNVKTDRFVAVESVEDTVYALSRSFLFKGISNGISTKFTKTELPQPPGFRHETGMFQTMWQIHSGEIFGLPGKLFVDLLGLITIFLSVTGIIYFFFPGWIKRRKHKEKEIQHQVRLNRWSLKWHNKAGAWLFIFLIILFLTGMFLRPPFLIAIVNSKVKPIPFSNLDQPNPWHDKLRDLLYDQEKNRFLLSTSEGMFYMDRTSLQPLPFSNQPPVSVMGINVFERLNKDSYLIGSFSGLFAWNPDYQDVIDVTNGKVYQENAGGRPIGNYKVTGLLTGVNGEKYMIDYDRGAFSINANKDFPAMPPQVLKASPMSLWSLSLEIHTGRFFQPLLGNFYILIVPLSSLISIMVVLSGYLFYRKKFKRKKRV